MATTIMAMPLKAHWTGKAERVTTVTGKTAIRCEYKIETRGYMWRTFAGSTCPSVIEVS